MTFSIVARDPDAGLLGLAVQSKAFGVGRLVHHIRSGVGAVASQAMVLPEHGSRTLAGIEAGLAPADTLQESLDQDGERASRQVIAIDTQGRTAAHTGDRCIRWAGHQVDRDVVVAGNILTDDTVVPAMLGAFNGAQGESLARRMLGALEAAQQAGGDLRGRQSAAMVVVTLERTGEELADRPVDLRVDDHEAPITELGRLLGLNEGSQLLDDSVDLIEAGEVDRAIERYQQARLALDHDPEYDIWFAAELASAGHADRAVGIIRSMRTDGGVGRWRELTARLVEVGMVDPTTRDRWWPAE